MQWVHSCRLGHVKERKGKKYVKQIKVTSRVLSVDCAA